MKFLKSHKNKILLVDIKYFVFLFFFIYLVVGLLIYKDYGISTDSRFRELLIITGIFGF